MNDTATEAATTSVLESRLRAVYACYDLHPDIPGLLSRVARQPGPLAAEDVAPLTRKLGLSTERLAAAAAAFDAVKARGLPALLFYKDGAVASFVPTLGEHGGVIGEPSAAEIDYALLFPPPESKTAHAVQHMIVGHTLDWFWMPITRYWREYVEIGLCSFFMNLFVLAMPMYTMNIYDRVAVNYSESTLNVLTIGIVIALGFDFFFRTMRAQILEHIAGRVSQKFDVDLMERLMSVRGGALHLRVGERMNLFRELQGIKDFYAGRLMPSLVDLPFMLLFIGVIFAISPELCLVPMAAVVLIFLATRALAKPIDRTNKKAFASVQSKSASLVETLAGMDTIKQLGAQGKFLFQWGHAAHQGVETSRRTNLVQALSGNVNIIIANFVTVATLYVGVIGISSGELTTGTVVACSLLAGRAVAPAIGLASIIAKLKQSSDVLKTIDKIFQLPHEEEIAALSAKGPFSGQVDLSGVSYTYPGSSRPALDGVNLVIKPGERVGLIGRTGAGKTTLARLLCRFMEPSAGVLSFDGYRYDAIPIEEWRRTVGYVPQDGFFFSGSIHSNITMGREDVSPETLAHALRVSGLDSILRARGTGLDTEVTEGGANLSGGQKQAMALARAIVRDPKFVVFDEPVNGIDNALEAVIKTELETFLRGRTFVMVTHRTSLLSLVDRLVLIDRGRVIADGPRDEMMRRLSGGAGGGAPA